MKPIITLLVLSISLIGLPVCRTQAAGNEPNAKPAAPEDPSTFFKNPKEWLEAEFAKSDERDKRLKTMPPPAPKPGEAEMVKLKQALAEEVKKQLVLLKGGSFEMGDWGVDGLSYDYAKDSKPLHKVTLDGFYMQPYKVTYEEFDLFTDDTGKDRVDMDDFGLIYRAPQSPAGVSWYGAQAYCTWLGELTQLPFALPTEAQWEYAARSGGKRVLFATDDGDIPKRGKNYPLTKDMDLPLPPVGSYPPNPAGLYDMSGDSIYEWVNDWYDENYYKTSPAHNPQGPKSGTHKVIRGGSAAFGMGSDQARAGLVFTKWKAPPQRIADPFAEKKELYPGYSSEAYDTFRCVVNVERLP